LEERGKKGEYDGDGRTDALNDNLIHPVDIFIHSAESSFMRRKRPSFVVFVKKSRVVRGRWKAI